jgi:uncharacterized membrane protein
MTAVDASDTPSAPPGARRPHHAVLDFFRDPARTFLVLALVAGGYLACVVPHFGGIDEPAHFYRAYQISTGRFVPITESGKSEFGGACIPIDVILQVRRASYEYLIHNAGLAGVHLDPNAPIKASDIPRCPGDPSKGFVTFSTFGPVPYAPQVGAALVSRGLGLDAESMLLVERFALLLSSVGLVWLAIRRSPRSKWALCAVGLLPVAVIQSGGTVSHDALTTAISLLVLSSTLRALDPPPGTSNRALIIEAFALSAVLGSCKPVYVVIAFLYLLPLLGPRRRKELWPLVIAPVIGVVVSLAWTAIIGNTWKTDAGYFNIRVDDVYQKHRLLTAPWDFAADTARAVFNQGLGWMKTEVAVGPSVTNWGWVLAVAVFAVYVLVSLQRDGREPTTGLHWLQRVLVVLVFVVGVVAIAAANYIYWTTPGKNEVGGIQPRYLVPLLPLVPVAIGGLDVRWARAATARIPVAVALVPALLVFLVSVTYRMY